MYDEILLGPDTHTTETILEYSDHFANQFYNVDLTKFDKLLFAVKYLNSELRTKWIDAGSARYCCKGGGYNFITYINEECSGNIQQFLTDKELPAYEEFQWWWVGKVCVYLRFRSGLSMREFLKVISVEEVLSMYHLGHEVGLGFIWNKVKDRFN